MEAGSDREGERLYSQDKTTKSWLQGGDETPISSNIFITVDSCIIYSKDEISMGKSHIINFVSRDDILNSPTNQELISSKILDANLQEQNLPLGQVIVLANNGRYIFNLVVRPQTNDKPFLNVLSGAFLQLRESMRILNIQSAKVS